MSQLMAVFWRSTSNTLSRRPTITTSHTTRHSGIPSERACSYSSSGMLSISSAIIVTNHTDMLDASKSNFNSCVPEVSNVKNNVNPTKLLNRSLENNVVHG